MSVADPRAMVADEPMHRAQIGAIAMAVALNALDGFDVLSISFASPGIAAEWGIDRAALGIVLSMELIGMAVGAILLGMAADRLGRRPTIMACLLVMAGGMAAASAATSLLDLSLCRLFTGFGIGGMLAATNAVVAEFANARRRNLAVAIMAGGYPVGAVVGGSIASLLLADGGHWQSVFRFGAIVTFAFLFAVWFLLPETIAFLVNRRPANALEKVNALLARMGREAVRVLPAVNSTTRSGRLAQLFAPGLVTVTILLTLGYFMHIMTFYFLMKWVPKIVADMHFPASLAGQVLVWANAGGATGSLTLALLTQRCSVRWLTIAAMIGSLVFVTLFGLGYASFAALSAVAFAAGFCANGANVGLYAMFAQSFPAQLRGSGTGFVIGLGRGGAALGPIAAGVLFNEGLPLTEVAGILACGSLVGAMALAALPYRENSLG